MKYFVRPGKAYLIIGCGCIITAFLFGVWQKVELERMFTLLYYRCILPLCLIVAISFIVFYFQTEIEVYDDKIVVHRLFHREVSLEYSQISQIRFEKPFWWACPMAIMKDKKIIIRIVGAFEGYALLRREFEEKCGDRIKYCY